MNADALLDSMRGLVIVVLRDGTIAEARGGFGGFLGLDVPSLTGTNVFDHVPATEADELATYFIENVDESKETIALPMPFRMSVVDGDGYSHPVDIVPTGQVIGDDEWLWTVMLMPVSLNGSITGSLDLEMAGAPHDVVRMSLCEELRVDNASYTSRWVMIDLQDPDTPEIFVARPEDQYIADAVAADLDGDGWQPWSDVAQGASEPLDVALFPPEMKALMVAEGWQRSVVAPVHVNDRLVAVFLLVGEVPPNYDPMILKRNVAARIQTLVRAAAMLTERWSDQARLRVAASTDELTGLFNRRELFARLGTERRTGSLLYVDVDDFKCVNDRFGHAVGDEVLVNVSRRIEAACRSQDTIGRVGGDEFVVVLPGADATLAHDIATRIIERVAEPLQLSSASLDVSVSIGHALLTCDDPLDAADHAMLHAKRSGRHLVAAVESD